MKIVLQNTVVLWLILWCGNLNAQHVPKIKLSKSDFEKVRQNKRTSVLSDELQLLTAKKSKGGKVGLTGNIGRSKITKSKTDRIVIHILKETDQTNIEGQLRELGLQIQTQMKKNVVGSFPISALGELENIKGIRYVKAVDNSAIEFHAGSVTSEADRAQMTDVLRSRYLTDGSGVKIGIISNSFNNTGGQEADVLSGDLPGPGNPNGFTTPVEVINDAAPFAGTPDEGRAMAQLIHDVAPGATLAFNTIVNVTDAGFAQAIDELVAVGCDIIVDDVTVFAEPVYMDGLTAQAVDNAEAQGILYFTSAGNSGRSSVYEKEYTETDIGLDIPAFDFNPDPLVNDGFLTYQWNSTSSIRLFIQWDEPFFSACGGCDGAQTEIDIFLFSELLNQIIPVSTVPELGGNPYISLGLTPRYLSEGQTDNVSLFFIVPDDNLPRPGRIKMKDNSSGVVLLENYRFEGPTSWGHPNAKGSISVGAAFWALTPEFNSDLEVPVVGFDGASLGTPTSVGGNETLFDIGGNRITPELRQNPDIVAPDGTSTTFFGQLVPNFSPNPLFFGTSAAAPTAAAVAGLLLEATEKTYSPAQIRNLLTSTALDLDDPYENGLQLSPSDALFSTGYDFTTGFGFIQPLAAMNKLIQQQGIRGLNLTSLCSDNPSETRRWRVRNPNPFAVEVRYHVYGTSQRGRLLAQGGMDTFFFTDATSGSNTTLIWWRDENGNRRQKVKASSGSQCQPSQARVSSDEQIDAQSTLAVNVEPWPNPSTGIFNLNLTSEKSGEVLIEVIDMTGKAKIKSFNRNLVEGSSNLQLDLTGNKAGVYILRISSNELQTSTRLMIK